VRIVVCGPAHPFRGGIATTTTAMVEALRGRGHSVEFLTPVRQYPRLLYPGGDVRDPEACAPVDGARAVFAPFEPWTWPGMRRAAREFGADAWILPFWTWAWAPMWRFLLAPRGRPAAIGIVHNLSDHDAGVARRRVADGVVSRFDGLMTHARVLGEALERRFPGLPVASHVLPPPSVVPGDLPGRDRARRSLGIGEDQRLAVFLGLIRPYKGVDVLLEAFGHLGGGSPWRLIVAGEAWSGLEKELIDRARALGLGSGTRRRSAPFVEGGRLRNDRTVDLGRVRRGTGDSGRTGRRGVKKRPVARTGRRFLMVPADQRARALSNSTACS